MQDSSIVGGTTTGTLWTRHGMYLAYWGLSRSPFAGGSTNVFYEGESQAEAIARMRFLVRDGRRAALVVGERGVGKTTLAAHMVELCRRENRLVTSLAAAGLTVRELHWQVAAQWALGPLPDDDVIRLQRRLADFAATACWHGAGAVIAVDDADQLGPDVRLELVRLAASMGHGGAATLLVLTTQPGGVQRLGDPLVDAIDLRIDLEPWSETETVGYVQHALFDAGCERPVFNDEALSTLFTLSGGMPRVVNRLADHALLGAAAEGCEGVDAGMVEAAHDALGWTATA